MVKTFFRLIALLPKIVNRVRGIFFRWMVIAAGGSCGTGMRIESGFRLRQGFHRGLNFGRDVYFGRNTTVDCVHGATFQVGSNATFTQGCFISVSDRVDIGEDSLIGEYVSLRDANHGISDLEIPITLQPMEAKGIFISDNVWLGLGVAVLAGVKIGTGAIIGANAVVTKSVAAQSIAVGVPAAVVKQRFPTI
jgi:acetyltransferase-like isoleucine patch superfamily enzyme